MGKMKKRRVYVVGHKNPDTDSICSAIAYADLKNKLNQDTSVEYVPKRAGQINEETQFVLNHFQVKSPGYVTDVKPKVRDIEMREVEGIHRDLSLKKAWDIMRDSRIVTLPIVEDQKLQGVITIGDIAYSDMDVYDNTAVSNACTSYSNIVETLEGDIIVGDIDGYFDKGNILIATANPDLMEFFINEHDMVILGNRYESQLCAIEMGASCIIVCMGSPVSITIKKLAKEKGVTIISSPYDTYVVTRLISHSMPVSYYMTKDNLVTFSTNDYVDDIQKIMVKHRFRDFPIEDPKGNYIGMISRRNLLDLKRKQIILVDHNETSQAVDGFDEAEILEIIDHHRLGNIETMSPVYFRNQPVGCTATIVTQMYQENGIEIEPKIAGLLCSAILSDTLMYRSPTCTPIDQSTAEYLAKIAGIEVENYARAMFTAGSNLTEKSPEEIFYQDFKKFSAGEVTFGVGQINSMDTDELIAIKDKLENYLLKAQEEHGLNMIFFMLTNIMDQATELICKGKDASVVVEAAFPVTVVDDSAILEGVVSRKKQLIPALLLAIGEM
ncbi:MAG: putative manganese-dependent inorganic diphosphatase [Lachnospiraceae bacterium]|nr:putative manganese-dependent inorganic diphosphatase [Lachnospiraceae bacterium]